MGIGKRKRDRQPPMWVATTEWPTAASHPCYRRLVKGKTLGIDATTLEANAALRSIGRRDNGEGYQECLTQLAKASGIGTPTRADLARIDRKRARRSTGLAHVESVP